MPQTSGRLQAGSSQVDITPNPGIALSGYIAREGKSIGVHDSLFASCLVLSNDGKLTAIVSCDILALDAPFIRKTRQQIQAETGISVENIMLACTHTHSGPATIFLQDCGDVDPVYMDELQTKIVHGVQQAASKMQPVMVGIAGGKLSFGVYDRRKPGSPIDPEIKVVYIWDDSQKPVALLINYACHPVVLNADNRLISADYPGVIRREVQKVLPTPLLFLTGACGNVDPVQRGSFEIADQFGMRIAQKALRYVAGMHPLKNNTLDIQRRGVNLPFLPVPTIAHIKYLARMYASDKGKAILDSNQLNIRVADAMLGWTRRIEAQIQSGNIKNDSQSEIQAVRIGRVVVLGVAGELFSQIGKNIKHTAGRMQVLISTCTNGSAGYIPDRDAYLLSSYEIAEAYKYYGDPSAFSPEAGDQVNNEAVSMLARWKRPRNKG